MKYLVVGLGNIGAEYEGTRHNAGFMVVDDFARRNGAFFSEQRYGALAEVSVKGRKIILLKPNTFMNLSGNAVRYWMQKENVQLENLLVIVDDLALPFGALRLKPKGSSAGHNGLKNIEELLALTLTRDSDSGWETTIRAVARSTMCWATSQASSRSSCQPVWR